MTTNRPSSPMGKIEMAPMFNVEARTVHVWRDRGHLPPWDYDSVNGSPAWERDTLLMWALRSGRAANLSDEDRADAESLLLGLADTAGAA